METAIEIFYGSLASSGGNLFKNLQIIDLPSLEQLTENVNEFLNKHDVEVLSIQHQCSEGLVSVLIYYKKK